MFSFEGNYQPKRCQKFDRSDKVTAAGIVQQSREERKKRELLRCQHLAATKLQAFARGVLCRLATKRAVGMDLDNVAAELASSATIRHTPDVNIELADFSQLLYRLLRFLNWYCRQKPDKDRLFIACRFILSKLGRASFMQWMSTESSQLLFVIGCTLRLILNYLATLETRVPSSDYATPVRVLEEVLCTTDSIGVACGAQQASNREWLYRFLVRYRYFRIMTQFIDRQLPSTAGYLTNVIDPNSARTFDSVEFMKVPQVRAFMDLLLVPITWAQTYQCSPMDQPFTHLQHDRSVFLRDLLIQALNDILVPDSTNYTTNERIVIGIGARLFDTPSTLQMFPHLCLSCSTAVACTIVSNRLVPSINLLYLLTTVIIPRLVSVDSVTFPTGAHLDDSTAVDFSSALEDQSEPPEHSFAERTPLMLRSSCSLPSTTAAEIVRSLAWLLIRALRSPGLPLIRPLKNPKPLILLRSDDTDESSDDDTHVREIEERASSVQPRHSHQQSFVYNPAWPTQLSEIFITLRQTLPYLASTALSFLGRYGECVNPLSVSITALSPDQCDLICSLSLLHYALDQIYGLPSTALIGLNSIYSQHPIFIRALWHLIQQSEVNGSLRNSFGASTGYTLFHFLTVGELPERMSDLQNYLPLVFTFVDCLRHRLMCLTDAEICGLDGVGNGSLPTDVSISGCGFRTEQLLNVAVRLRDLMLGLIDLSHPDQVPKYSTSCFDEYTSLSRGVDAGVICCDPVVTSYREVFDRLEQRAKAAASGTPGDANSVLLQRSGWSVVDLRIQLQCWTNLFRRVQRLVFQIYDWDRRCHRQSSIDSDIEMRDPILLASDAARLSQRRFGCDLISTDSHPFWVKDTIANTVDTSLRPWLQHGSDKDKIILTGVPFGYYSRLNPDKGGNAEPFLLSNREIRQILILKEMPFVIPFERRVRLFQLLVDSSRAAVQGSYVPSLAALASYADSEQYPDLSILVRRTHLYEDAFDKLSKENEPSLQPRLRVRFMNQVGAVEAGVDGGGLSREFLSELIRDGFDPTRGFFVYTAEKTLYPNPQVSAIVEDYLKHYYFLGRILAKALYEGMLVELRFAHFFLAKVASRSGGGVGFDYLHSLDPELYRQLRYLKTYSGDVRSLSLDFTVVQSTFGQSDTVELKPGGRHIPVTNENRVEYVHLMAHYKLNRQIYPQSRAFIAGLNDVICIDWLRLFDAEELQTLISGADTAVDIDDLEKHTIYVHDSSEYKDTLEHFWAVLRSFAESDKRLFLRFVTACSRPPMFGFRDLQPPFSIQITQELERLPTASTCMNLLRLPNFRDFNVIRERLLYALHANAGFEYS